SPRAGAACYAGRAGRLKRLGRWPSPLMPFRPRPETLQPGTHFSAMARSKTSKAWMHEHVTDVYVQRAKAQGYRSRAAFKLLEIDARDRLLRPGQTVIDLGAAPGGWSQVAAAKVGKGGRVLALDLLPLDSIAGVTFIQGDFTEDAALAALDEALGGA